MTSRILIVEDDEGIILPLVGILEDVGCAVDVARDGAEAIPLLADVTYDAVFLDIRMPNLTGDDLLTLLPYLLGQGWHERLKIVVITADTRFNDDALRALGAASVLRKPFSLDDVLSAVS